MNTILCYHCANAEEFNQRLDWIYAGMEDPRKIAVFPPGFGDRFIIRFATSKEKKEYSAQLSREVIEFVCTKMLDENFSFISTKTLDCLAKWKELSILPSSSLQEKVCRIVLKKQSEQIDKQRQCLAQQTIEQARVPLALHGLNALRNNTETTDLVFILAEGKQLRAHFCLLSKFQFFKDMQFVSGKHEEPISPFHPLQLNLPAFPFSETAVNQFLDFVYGLGLPQQLLDPGPLFALADYLQYDELMKEILSSQMRSNAAFVFDVLSQAPLSFSPSEQAVFGPYIEELEEWIKVDKKTIEIWTERAKDHPLAQILLGVCYQKGLGVEKNEKCAFEWLKRAADQGHSLGQALLGRCYAKGTGVEINPDEAFNQYSLSAIQGDPLGACLLGLYYLNGIGGTSNADHAFAWFKISATQGHPRGQFELGQWYLRGRGAQKDTHKAFKWINRSASQNYPQGMAGLAQCYEKGLGCSRNLDLAKDLYAKAAAKGDAFAQRHLEHLSRDALSN